MPRVDADWRAHLACLLSSELTGATDQLLLEDIRAASPLDYRSDYAVFPGTATWCYRHWWRDADAG